MLYKALISYCRNSLIFNYYLLSFSHRRSLFSVFACLVSLFCLADNGFAQGRIKVTFNENGKITDVSTGLDNVQLVTPVISRPQPLFPNVEKNLSKLIREIARIQPDTHFIRNSVFEHIKYINGLLDTELLSDTLLQVWDGNNKRLASFNPRISCDYFYTIKDHPKIQLSKKNVVNAALLSYYNSTANTYLRTHWENLFQAYKTLTNIQDTIYQHDLMSNRASKKVLDSLARKEYQFMLDRLDKISKSIDFLILWSTAWLGFFDDKWTLDPLGFPDKEVLPLLKDSVQLIRDISNEKALLEKLPEFNERYITHLGRLNNFENRLELIRASAVAYQNGIKKGAAFSEWTIFNQLALENGCNYNRFHDAASDLELLDKEHFDNNADISTDEKVCITIINVPFDSKVQIVKDSKPFVQELQFTRLAGGIVNMFTKSEQEKARAHPVSKSQTLSEIVNDIEKIKSTIAPFLAQLPPMDQITYAEKPVIAGYKTKSESIGPFESDSSMKNTYTVTVEAKDTTEKPLQKTFKYKAYKKSRVQFVAGVHFFTGDAPVVERNGNTFKLTSTKSIKYSAGIKVYAFKQTFSDVTWANWLDRSLRSVHGMVAVDLDKPLENLYFGPGIDILPGLGVDVGAHLYKYTNYQLYNGEVVGESNTLRFRRGVYIALNIDGSLLNKVFTSFLKLRVK